MLRLVLELQNPYKMLFSALFWLQNRPPTRSFYTSKSASPSVQSAGDVAAGKCRVFLPQTPFVEYSVLVKLLFQMITCSLCRVCRTIFVDFETVVWYDQGKMMALFRSTERLTALPGARSRRRLAVKYRRSRSSSGAAVGILLSFSFCLIFVSCIATIALPVGIGKPSSLSAKGYSRD